MTSEYQAAGKCLAESDEAGSRTMKRSKGGAGYLWADIARLFAGGSMQKIEKHQHWRALQPMNARN